MVGGQPLTKRANVERAALGGEAEEAEEEHVSVAHLPPPIGNPRLSRLILNWQRNGDVDRLILALTEMVCLCVFVSLCAKLQEKNPRFREETDRSSDDDEEEEHD